MPRAFLAAMLERVQAERGQRRRVLMAEDAEDAALLVQLVVVRQGPDPVRQRRTIRVVRAVHCAVPPSLFSISWSMPCWPSAV